MNTHADKTNETKSNTVANSMGVQQGVKQETFQLEDNRPETIAQRKIQEAANNSEQVKQLRAVQAMANNSLQVKQFIALESIINNGTLIKKPADSKQAQSVVQRQITVHHYDHNEDDGRASHVEAVIDGDPLGAGANPPATYPDGWGDLSEKFVMDDVFRMHLWNGRLGGPGNWAWNLTPGGRDANDEMANAEVAAQDAARDGHLINLETDVQYNHAAEPEYYYPTHIDFSWTAEDTDDGTVVDNGNWASNIPLPEEKDMDWDPNNPDDLGMEDSDDSGN